MYQSFNPHWHKDDIMFPAGVEHGDVGFKLERTVIEFEVPDSIASRPIDDEIPNLDAHE